MREKKTRFDNKWKKNDKSFKEFERRPIKSICAWYFSSSLISDQYRNIEFTSILMLLCVVVLFIYLFCPGLSPVSFFSPPRPLNLTKIWTKKNSIRENEYIHILIHPFGPSFVIVFVVIISVLCVSLKKKEKKMRKHISFHTTSPSWLQSPLTESSQTLCRFIQEPKCSEWRDAVKYYLRPKKKSLCVSALSSQRAVLLVE